MSHGSRRAALLRRVVGGRGPTSRPPVGRRSSASTAAWLAFSGAALALVALVHALPAAAFEAIYLRRLYPAATRLLAPATAWTSLPLGLTLTLAAIVGGVVWLLRGRRSRARLRGVHLIALVALLLSLFVIVWGANYRRPPLEQALGLPTSAAPPEMVKLADALADWVVAEAEAPVEPVAAISSVAASLERHATGLGYRVHVPSRVKLLPPGSLLVFGYAGVVWPFTLEAHIDSALTPSGWVAVGAHELAHLAGVAGEADAELLALLAGLEAAHPFARYATALGFLSRLLPALPADEAARVASRLPERARSDLASARRLALQYRRPSLAGAVAAVYDRYLRSQGVGVGTADYGRALELGARALSAGILPTAPR